MVVWRVTVMMMMLMMMASDEGSGGCVRGTFMTVAVEPTMGGCDGLEAVMVAVYDHVMLYMVCSTATSTPPPSVTSTML